MEDTTTKMSLEASTDGRGWDRLPLEAMPPTLTMTRRNMLGAIDVALHNGSNETIRSNGVVDLAEAYLRKSWRVEQPTHDYYSYFRFASPSGEYTNLAGVGLDIFGDIHEE